ncbi:acyl carrier protein [Gemmobacter caeruleus]|uniref:acyl carrier protein n=1 Tax=Gemmobacter caeruleus TaxID=2595004 RepID=UPI0011EC7CC0|nr:acyl carrier protein [Gemmobacter caeruleus]
MTQIARIRAFICAEFAPDIQPQDLPADLDLIQSGIIDSLGVLKLVAFLEDDCGIAIAPEELDAELYQSLDAIAALIDGKTANAA